MLFSSSIFVYIFLFLLHGGNAGRRFTLNDDGMIQERKFFTDEHEYKYQMLSHLHPQMSNDLAPGAIRYY